MYLPVPMRGKFDFSCELTAPAGREIRVAYGGHVLGLKADKKHLERSQIGRPMPDVAITPPIEKAAEWYAAAARLGRPPALRLDRRPEGPRGAAGDGVRPLVGVPEPSDAVRIGARSRSRENRRSPTG